MKTMALKCIYTNYFYSPRAVQTFDTFVCVCLYSSTVKASSDCKMFKTCDLVL